MKLYGIEYLKWGTLFKLMGLNKGGVLMINELMNRVTTLKCYVSIICSSGMHGFQQGTQLPQCVPSQYTPAPSSQAAGNMAG